MGISEDVNNKVQSIAYICEYIWIGGNYQIRSKTRVINQLMIDTDLNPNNYPTWNYDGSSTGQSDSDGNTEIILKPCVIYKNPLRQNFPNMINLLILCDTYDIKNNPLQTNSRYHANILFNKKLISEPWFGLEQEYFIENKADIESNTCPPDQGEHYCGSVKFNPNERSIVEEHLYACITAGITISGINSEVACRQWEFQIGPCTGIQAGDQMIIARYLLERISEKYGYTINYKPKPYDNVNGSGCHVNFSTIDMRNTDGIHVINNAIEKLNINHAIHIEQYGIDNNKRLSGTHETSDYNVFSFGVGTRNTAIRIPTDTVKNNCGYFEDRRPGSNIDPYVVTSAIFSTCCIEKL
jgi:glutamine synthetase